MELAFRWIFLVILLLLLLISGTYRRRARQSGDVIARREEGLPILLLRMGLAIPLLASLLLYVVYPGALAWSQLSLPAWLRWLATGVALLTLPFVRWVFRSIGRNISETVLTKRDHELVMAGPYRWIRHPLYASALLVLFSLSLVASSWFLLLYSLAALVVFRVIVIPVEEEQLTKTFGEAYRGYQSHSGALFPRLF
ncbi:MAG: isoprenylcysteine carboxylmethyltransferase family protein [Anaerolineales bacterium]|nr:MAG: isoprenylcysteine carboxylmethyltransferase family protein [Anaerolineales bacterium]